MWSSLYFKKKLSQTALASLRIILKEKNSWNCKRRSIVQNVCVLHCTICKRVPFLQICCDPESNPVCNPNSSWHTHPLAKSAAKPSYPVSTLANLVFGRNSPFSFGFKNKAFRKILNYLNPSASLDLFQSSIKEYIPVLFRSGFPSTYAWLLTWND